MEKIVYFENKRITGVSVMELPIGYGKRIKHNTKVYVFDDGSFIKASETKGKKFKYVCSECGKEVYSTTKPDQCKTATYICVSCRSINHNPFKGKHHTEEYKQKSSERMKGKYSGEKNPMFGKNIKDYMSDEAYEQWKKNISKSVSGEKNPMFGKNIKDYMSDEAYDLWKQHIKENGYHSKSKEEQEILSKKMSDGQCALRNSNPEYYKMIKSKGGKVTMSKPQSYEKSSIEVIVENWLIEHNVDFEYSPIMGSDGKIYQYDFIIHKKRILIEVQGDYWHGNPNLFNEIGDNEKRKLNDIQKKNIKRDGCKLKFAHEHNFEVIYIWEEDIKNGDFSKLDKLL